MNNRKFNSSGVVRRRSKFLRLCIRKLIAYGYFRNGEKSLACRIQI